MPIVSRTNNRVLPANQRASDVARKAVADLTLVERNRYHNAFKVQGIQGVLYHAMTCGQKCHCKNSGTAINSRLGLDGKASVGFLNEMLTGGLEFGVLPYATRPASPAESDPNISNRALAAPALAPDPYPSNGSFVIDQDLVYPNPTPRAPPVKPTLPSLYESDGIDEFRPAAGTPFDRYTKDPLTHPGATVVGSGVGPNGPIADMEFTDIIGSDAGASSITDYNCPVCMGTGFVGGFSILNGWRRVLTFQDATAKFSAPGDIYLEETVPHVSCTTAEFTLVLPAHGVGVDALRVWNLYSVVSPLIQVDGSALVSQQDLLRFCDGRSHTISLTFDQPSDFTHLEIQVNQSLDMYLFDLPKTTQSNTRSLLQNMQDMTILMSPKVPIVNPGDFLAECAYGTVLAIASVPAWNDNRRTVIGWECEVRPVQPQELHSLLPRRRPLASLNSPPLVRDNVHGHRRT